MGPEYENPHVRAGRVSSERNFFPTEFGLVQDEWSFPYYYWDQQTGGSDDGRIRAIKCDPANVNQYFKMTTPVDGFSVIMDQRGNCLSQDNDQRVRMTKCNSNKEQQQWVYDDTSEQVRHGPDTRFCLAYNIDLYADPGVIPYRHLKMIQCWEKFNNNQVSHVKDDKAQDLVATW